MLSRAAHAASPNVVQFPSSSIRFVSPVVEINRPWEPFMRVEKSSNGERDVTALVEEMQTAIVDLAGERGWGETREAWLAKAARRAGISYRRARAFFYREAPRPRNADVEAVRSAIRKLEPVGTGHDTTRREIATEESAEALRARIGHLSGELARIGGELDALRAHLDRL